MDTAQALHAAAGVGDHCSTAWNELRDVLKRRALEFQHTVQIGRTHGVHAEPITFGLKLAIWYEEAGRNLSASASRGGRPARRQDLGRGGHVRAYRPGGRGSASAQRLGSEARAGGFAGDPARPARRFRGRAGAAHRASREDRARSAPPAAHRSARGGGVFRQGPEGQLGHAAQAQPGHLRADLRPGARGARQTRRRRSKTSRCGTSATFRIPRSSA